MPVPCFQHPRVLRGRPVGTTTSKSLVAPVSLVKQDMVPMQPPSLGFLQYHEVPGYLWGPPCTHQSQGWGAQLRTSMSHPAAPYTSNRLVGSF